VHIPVRVLSIVLLNGIVAVMLVGFGPPKLVDREVAATIRLTTGDLQEWYRAAQPPSVSAAALLVYDVDTDRVLYSRNSEVALAPASLTKLMTALLVLEAGQLEDKVQILAQDLVGGTVMGLTDGETVSVEELLWGLIVPSGNDAAMALARYVGGDVETFVQTMNARAAQLGLEETLFANPHGLDGDVHLSSARDMLTITLKLLEYPLFREMVGTVENDVAGRRLVNTNEMLQSYPGSDGIKTGTTQLAGQCLIASITAEGHRLIIVVMGSNDRYGDVANLHALYSSNYHWVNGNGSQLSVLNRLYTEDGQAMSLRTVGEPVSVLLHRWGDPDLLAYRNIDREMNTDLEPFQQIGVMEWRVGDDLVATYELAVR
jgi:D-alanyl-D-alanine carboxypeptidase